MKTYITSDLHFGHKRIIEFNSATRPYSTIEEMDDKMIEQWNEVVTEDDTVYILGDFAFHKPYKAAMIARQLNGRKILIQGNHDEHCVTKAEFRDCFVAIHNYHEIKYNGTKVCMFHYPIAEWNQCHHGSVMLHGHLHDKKSGFEQYRMRNVCFDNTGKIVSLLDDIIEDALTGEIKKHGWTND